MKPKREQRVKKLDDHCEFLSKEASCSSNNESPEESQDGKNRRDMYERKPRFVYGSRSGEISPPQDSGSESTPLLNSESHVTFAPMIFHDSETSDVDSCSITSSPSALRYGSIGGSSFNSTAILPRGLPLKGHKSPLVAAPHTTNISPPPPYSRDGYYKIDNSLSDLLLEEPIYKEKHGTRPAVLKEIAKGFLPAPLPLIQDAPPSITSKDNKRTQSSLVTIFSIWNTILGSSLLTMPWGIAMAGLIPGIGLILAMGALCLYTAQKLLQVHKHQGAGYTGEVTALSRVLLGPWAEYIAKIFSVTVMLGANIAYWVLMSNFLFYSVNFVYDVIAGLPLHPPYTNESRPLEVLCPRQIINNESYTRDRTYDNLGPIWDLYKTVPIFLAILIFPLLNFSSATFFMKFNCLGTISVIYLIVFVVLKSTSWGVNMDDEAWENSWELKSSFPALCGMLALSFFIHNIIITIMQNNKNQKNNGRDLTIAYILVTFTYVLIGTMFYVSFPIAKSCIEDNLLNNFQKWDALTVGARIVLLFQLLTVYPLIAYMLRIQILTAIFESATYTKNYVLIANVTTVTICVLFAMFIPRVGTIIRYTGAMSGFIYIFTLPSLLHLALKYKQGKMTVLSTVLHLSIPLIGGCNLAAQIFIPDN